MKTFILKKTAGTSLNEIYGDIKNGGRFIVYCYCISIVALTFKQISPPYFIRPGEPTSKYRLKYTIRSLLFGWWGLPWGPIHTIDRILINNKNGGGLDITEEIVQKLQLTYLGKDNESTFEEDIILEYGDEEVANSTKQNGSI
jgi:hypothetical protein